MFVTGTGSRYHDKTIKVGCVSEIEDSDGCLSSHGYKLIAVKHSV